MKRLPQQERHPVGGFFLVLLFGRSDAVAGLVVHPEQDRLAAGWPVGLAARATAAGKNPPRS